LCRISIIVACARNRVIGQNGRLAWDIPEDWEYFLEKTREGTLLFGRHCYEELMERTKEGRKAVVLSRNPEFQPEFGVRAESIPQALEIARSYGREIWICGGEQVYRETLPIADRLLLTQIDSDVEGDTYFPDWEEFFPHEVNRQESSDKNFKYTFHTFAKHV
jgi:dihydrofolate reductase